MKKTLLILMTLFTVGIGYSQIIIDNSISYIVTSNTAPYTVRVFDYDAAGSLSVNIPPTITNANGTITYTVTAIQQMAFNGNQITDVVIPNTVTSIGLFAFLSNQLTSVVIPNSVTTIGLGAFQGNQINNVTISTSLTSIEDQVFFGNELQDVTIPSNVTSLGQAAFSSNLLTNVSMLGVTNIGQSAFQDNQFTSITIPDNVTTIGNSAFNGNPLSSVISLSTTPPTIQTANDLSDSFSSVRSGIDLTIPAGTEDVYVTNTGALWTGFNTVNGVSLSTSDFELANNVIVVTTPNELNVISSGTSLLENYTIYSITGAKVKEGTENTIAIDVLSKGIYIIELTFDMGKLTKKFVK